MGDIIDLALFDWASLQLCPKRIQSLWKSSRRISRRQGQSAHLRNVERRNPIFTHRDDAGGPAAWSRCAISFVKCLGQRPSAGNSKPEPKKVPLALGLRVVFVSGARMHRRQIVDELDITWIERDVEAELGTGCKFADHLQGVHLRPAKPRPFRKALCRFDEAAHETNDQPPLVATEHRQRIVWLAAFRHLCIAPFLAAFIQSLVPTPVLTSRNLIVILPAIYLLLARGVCAMPYRAVPAQWCGVVILSQSYQIEDYLTEIGKERFDQAASYVLAQAGQPSTHCAASPPERCRPLPILG